MSPGVNLVMTVIGFTVSTMFIVFVCTRLICARIQLTALRHSFSTASRSDLSTIERGLHGVEPVVVANFPTKKYSDPFFPFAEDAQCIVCLSEYHGEDTLRILPFCGHAFHTTCIDIWLQQRSTCPVCRISLRDHQIPEKKQLMQPMFSSTSTFRSHQYGSNSLDMNPCHCLPANQQVLLREHDNRGINPTRESEGGGGEGSESTKYLEIKLVESPSNA
ncbi:hypothetical protein LguiA_031946 [Lonicera macranthoides]